MRSRQLLIAGCVCLAVFAVCLPAWGQADQPASAPSLELAKGQDQVNAEQLADLAKLIRTTDSPEAAMAAYAKGCAIDRTSVELQRAYMVRMVQLRKPDIAAYAAKPLITFDSSNGLAWEVVGYANVLQNDLDTALSNYLQANQFSPKTNSVQHNLAQLISWYEHQKPAPTLPPADKKALAQAKTDLAGDPDFDNGYKRGNAAFDALAAARTKAQKDLADTQKDLTTAKTQVNNLKQQMVTLNTSMNTQQRGLDNLRNDLNHAVTVADRNNIQTQINSQQQQLNNQQRQHDQLAQKGRDAVATEDKKQKLADDLKAKITILGTQQPKTFQWAPPVATGVTPASQPAPAPTD